MISILRCTICNQEFDGYDEEGCLNHEIICSGEDKKTNECVIEAIRILSNECGVEFIDYNYGAKAATTNFGHDYSTYKYFNGNAKYKDKEFKFYINNDSVGDGREENTLDSSDNIIRTFKNKYLNEKEIKRGVIEGVVKRIEDEDDYCGYSLHYKIGDHWAHLLLDDLEGKFIKIEVR